MSLSGYVCDNMFIEAAHTACQSTLLVTNILCNQQSRGKVRIAMALFIFTFVQLTNNQLRSEVEYE